MGSDAENITFMSKRQDYDCNYFYLLISRIIRLNFQRGGSGASWKILHMTSCMVHLRNPLVWEKFLC